MPLAAQTTRVNVRVVAHDAKIIGDGVGGAKVTIQDPATGRILAEGIQQGSTGDTRSIMVEARSRASSVYDTDGAAVFTAELALDGPTVLDFIGEGPLGFEHAMQRTVKRMLVVPGEDILGDGVVLELHGFIVEVVAPDAFPGAGTAEVTARVRMLCGCTHTPGGMWDANRIEVSARLYAGKVLIRETRLGYAGEPNMFSGGLSLDGVAEGGYVVVVVSDPDRENFGSSRRIPLGG
jgi:hypothetical protein